MSYEYKVVPAPSRGLKAKGVKTVEDRFANALETEINTLAKDGWEYVRADTLPCEQREGLMSKTTVYQNMLVFRRTKSAQRAHASPQPAMVAPRPKTGQERVTEKQASVPPKPPEAPKVTKPLVAAKPDKDADTDLPA